MLVAKVVQGGDMTIIYFLIPLALVILVIAVAAFCWAVNADQFDDLEKPAYEILFDDKATQTKERIDEQ